MVQCLKLKSSHAFQIEMHQNKCTSCVYLNFFRSLLANFFFDNFIVSCHHAIEALKGNTVFKLDMLICSHEYERLYTFYLEF